MYFYGIPLQDIIISCVAWMIIIFAYIAIYVSGTVLINFILPNYKAILGAYVSWNDQLTHNVDFSSKIRRDWIIRNHLNGNVSTSVMREYIRVLIFLATTAIVITALISGFATQLLSKHRSPYENYLFVKFACMGIVFLTIFFVLLTAIRYAIQFRYKL